MDDEKPLYPCGEPPPFDADPIVFQSSDYQTSSERDRELRTQRGMDGVPSAFPAVALQIITSSPDELRHCHDCVGVCGIHEETI
jgi:hypothetical protein